MMLKVHEYSVDRATHEARILGTHPIRRWNSDAHPTIQYQDGKFYDDGGHEMALADVPEEIKQQVALHPVRPAGARAEDVLRFCPICAQSGKDFTCPSSQMEQHLIQHIEKKLLPEKPAEE